MTVHYETSHFQGTLKCILTFYKDTLFFGGNRRNKRCLCFFRHFPPLSTSQVIFYTTDNFRCDLSRNIYRTITRMIIFPIKRTEHLRGNPVIILRYRIAPERMLRTEQGCIQLLSGNHFHPGAVHQELLFVRIGHHGKFLCRKRRSLYHLGYDGQRAGKIFIQRVKCYESIVHGRR